MNKTLLILFAIGLLLFHELHAQHCDTTASCFNLDPACVHSDCGSINVRYLTPIFNETEIIFVQRTFACISDSLDPCADSNKLELKMDIYYNPNDCQCCNKPAVLLASSGGFHAMDKRSELMVHLCTEFAKRGFVAISMKYRTGYPDCCNGSNLPPECGYVGDHGPYDEIAYQGHQDATAAVRYLKSRAGELGINPDQIFMGGSSAGGVLALHTAYLNESEIQTDLINKFGPLNRYGVQGYDWQVAGVLSMWGTIKDPAYLFDGENGAAENEPLIMFHGTCDPTYPYDVGRYLCFTDSLVQNPYTISGPQHIKETIEDNSLPICYKMVAGCGFAHGIHRRCAGDEFGGGGYITEQGDFMVERTSQFIYNHVLTCSVSACVAEDEFICKPCYCARCHVVNTNADLEGCQHCSAEPKFGTTKPAYLEYCHASNQDDGFVNCQAVFALDDTVPNPHISNVHMTAVVLNWEKLCGYVRYEIRIREVGVSAWNTILINDTSRLSKTLFGLVFGATYEWQIRVHYNLIGTVVSPWTEPVLFTTLCTIPETMFTDPIGSGGARFNWSEILDAHGYQVRGRKVGQNGWLVFMLPPSTLSLNVTKLKPSTFYEWQIRTVCDSLNPETSNWSPSNIFKTAKTGRYGYFNSDKRPSFCVFPNPVAAELKIQVSSGFLLEGLKLRLLDLNGQLLYSKKVEAAATQVIDVSKFPGGIYQLVLQSGEERFVEKVAVVH